MKAQLPNIQMASEQLTGVCAELDRLARRIEAIRNAVLTSTAAAAAAAVPRPQPPARSTPSFPPVRKELPPARKRLPPVPGLTTEPEVIAKVKASLMLDTRKEAEIVAGAVIGALEETLIENLGQNGFSIKLGKFGKFSIRHRLGTYRKIPLTGETKMTSTKRKVKFLAIGRLRQREKVSAAR